MSSSHRIGPFLSPWAVTYTPVLGDQLRLLLAPTAWEWFSPQPPGVCRSLSIFPLVITSDFMLPHWLMNLPKNEEAATSSQFDIFLEGFPERLSFAPVWYPEPVRFTCGHTSFPLPQGAYLHPGRLSFKAFRQITTLYPETLFPPDPWLCFWVWLSIFSIILPWILASVLFHSPPSPSPTT